jgi:hypothetical protein
MEHLIKEEILAPLDFSNLGHYIECIKGKYVKHIKKTGATRSSGVLEIIHTDICGPFNVSFVDSLIHLLPSRMISPTMVIFISYVSNTKHLISLRYLRLKWKA